MKDFLKREGGWIVTLVFILLCMLIDKAWGEDFKLTKPSCYPVWSDVVGGPKVLTVKLLMKAETDVILWYCDTPRGLEQNYRTGNFGRPCEQCFREDLLKVSLDQLFIMDRAAFARAPNAAEQLQADKAIGLYEPRCSLIPTTKGAKTVGVRQMGIDGKIGASRFDAQGREVRVLVTAPADCYDWIVDGPKRYCSVFDQLDTRNQKISPNGYVACKLETAPEAGWPVVESTGETK